MYLTFGRYEINKFKCFQVLGWLNSLINFFVHKLVLYDFLKHACVTLIQCLKVLKNFERHIKFHYLKAICMITIMKKISQIVPFLRYSYFIAP